MALLKQNPVTREIIVSDPQAEILESTADVTMFHAGVGSGKTHVATFVAYEFIFNFPQIRGFIGANTYSQLSKSTLDRIFTTLQNEFGILRDVHYVVNKMPPKHFKVFGAPLESYKHTISFINGHMIITGSLDNYTSIDGTEFGYAILDETKDTKEEAVTEVIMTRLRQKGMYIDAKGTLYHTPAAGRRGFNPLYIFTSPAKVDWIIKWFSLDLYFEEIESVIYEPGNYFRKRIGNKFVVISSTYHNERNLPAGYIEKLVDNYKHSKELGNMLIFGSPMSKSGGEFYEQYNRITHVKPCVLKTLPVHTSFDFNLHPHMTSTFVQVEYTPGMIFLRFIDELVTPAPKNNAEALAIEIRKQWGETGRLDHGWFYEGDYNGNAGNMITMEKHSYHVIEKVLHRYKNNGSKKVIKNERLYKRKDFANKLLAGGFPDITIEIDPKCKNLIADLQFTKVDANGQKVKKLVLDEATGIKYQKYGHSSDTFDYAVCSILNYHYKNS